jgi:hypothetical protein
VIISLVKQYVRSPPRYHSETCPTPHLGLTSRDTRDTRETVPVQIDGIRRRIPLCFEHTQEAPHGCLPYQEAVGSMSTDTCLQVYCVGTEILSTDEKHRKRTM